MATHLERTAMTPQASHLSAHTDSRRAAPRRSSRLRAILLATSALASVALPATLAYAGDATWTPGSTDFNIGDNWTGTPDKTVPIDGTATFNASSQRAIVFTESTSVGGMTVTSGAGDYTFDTNNQNLTFTGAGLSVQGGASLTLNNNGGSNTIFSGNSSAGASTIANDGSLLFNDESKAGSSSIINNNGLVFSDSSGAEDATIVNHGAVVFTGSSTADKAFIKKSNGFIFFEQQSSGGTARIQLDNGNLDISGLITTGTTVGSLEGSGTVVLGDRNLAVGGNNRSTEFSGVIQDGGGLVGGTHTGSLTKEGTGALTLTGINTYTGATVVSGGALVVDGSIALSSGVTVNAGGTLTGNGIVSSTTVNAGGTLAPGYGDGRAVDFLQVRGDLTFSAGATYRVQVSPEQATSTAVTGTAT